MRHIIAGTILLSSMLVPAVANATPSSDDVTASTPNLRVSTGVIAPSLAGTIAIAIPESLSKSLVPSESQVGLSLTVDADGKAENIKIVKPSNPYLDARIVEAIQKAHFRPGTVDNTPTPVDMNLTVVLGR
jgi:TonB family protein